MINLRLYKYKRALTQRERETLRRELTRLDKKLCKILHRKSKIEMILDLATVGEFGHEYKI